MFILAMPDAGIRKDTWETLATPRHVCGLVRSRAGIHTATARVSRSSKDSEYYFLVSTKSKFGSFLIP